MIFRWERAVWQASDGELLKTENKKIEGNVCLEQNTYIMQVFP